MRISRIFCGFPRINNYNNIHFKGNNINTNNCDTVQLNNTTHKNPAKYYLDSLSTLLSDKNLQGKDILTIQKNILNLSSKDKEEFIKLYCETTGFPDMQKTSKLILEDITSSLLKAANKTSVQVILAGYNPTCSVGNGHALPGSDFDTFFICLKNWDNFDEFKEQFKSNVNPLLCSVVRTRTNDVPDFVILDDITNSIELAQNIFDEKNLKNNAETYAQTLDKQIKDWTIAGKYNLDINEFVEDEDKTPLLRAGLLMEIYRDGAMIVDYLDEDTKEKLKKSCVYQYSNMQQMRSYQTAPLKNKHLSREKILSNFDTLNTDKKLEMIFNIINLSVKSLKDSVLEEYTPMFKDAGCGNMEDLMQPLLTNNHRLPEYRK